MGISITQYRAKIGAFCGGDPARCRKPFKMATLVIPLVNCHTSLSIKLCLVCLLLVAGDIESNPGPPKLRSNDPVTKEDIVGINTKLDKIIAESEYVHEKLDHLQSRMDSIEDDMTEVRDSIESNTQKFAEMESNTQAIHDIKTVLNSLKKDNDDLRRANDDLENRGRRNNLVFYGVSQEDTNESWSNSEEKVKTVLSRDLGIKDNIEFERVHRITNAPEVRGFKPIIAKFSRFKDKAKVFAAAKKLKGSEISIGEDFSKRIRTIRTKLLSCRKSMLDENPSLRAQKNGRVSYKKSRDWEGYIYRCDFTVDSSPKNVETILTDIPIHLKWNKHMKKIEKLKDIEEGLQLRYSVSPSALMGLISSRDFCTILGHTRIPDRDIVLVYYESVEYDGCGPVDKLVRGFNYPSGTAIFPVEGEPGKSTVVNITQVDAKVRPRSLAEKVYPSVLLEYATYLQHGAESLSEE